jgi:adenylate cyclase
VSAAGAPRERSAVGRSDRPDWTEGFGRVLAEERLWNSRQIAILRFLAASGLLLLSLGYCWLYPDFIGAPNKVLALYVIAAGVVLWVRQRTSRAAQLDALAIPLVDMPMVCLLLWVSSRQLHEAGAHADASAVPLQGVVYFALLIFLASLSLDVAQIYLAAAVAIGLQAWLIYAERPDLVFVILETVLTLGMTTLLCAYARGRIVTLVDVVAREQLRRERLGRYFSPQVAEHLEQHSAALGDGETREVTLLFADLRDFTALAEKLDGREIVATLNAFHTCMVEQLFSFGGTLDKYMGDGLMAYFGAPVVQPDHPERAVRCALAMQRELGRLNDDRRRRGQSVLRMGIGIHTGRVTLGDIGAPRRRDYTAVGDTVNVAARIEQLTKVHGVPILVSEETRRRIVGDIGFTPAEPVRVKGKSEPLQTHVPDSGPDVDRV